MALSVGIFLIIVFIFYLLIVFVNGQRPSLRGIDPIRTGARLDRAVMTNVTWYWFDGIFLPPTRQVDPPAFHHM